MTPGDFGEFAGSEQFMEEFTTSLGMSLMSSAWSYILSIVAYIFMAVGMYAIANRRGIKHAWLAWIPFGSTWLLGCISDQYRYVVMGQEKSKRKVMLGLEIAVSVIGTVAMVMLFYVLFNMMSLMPDLESGSNAALDQFMTESMGLLLVSVLLCFVMLGVAIAHMVLYYMAMHDLFKSCSPENATMYLVLGIFLGNILMSLFVFASRKKDLGMPPRQDQVVYTQPVFQPQQPPVWQPQQPPVEPWEQNNEQI